MKTETLNIIKNNLILQQIALIKKLKQTIDVDVSGDDVDQVQGNLIANIATGLAVKDAEKLSQINLALQKISEGTYGKCQDCEEDISDRRLEFNPHFSICIFCADQREFDQKQVR